METDEKQATARTETASTLSYCLGKGVSVFDRNGSPALMRQYPLKYVILKPLWKPVFDRFSEAKMVMIDQISSLVDSDDTVSVCRFLDRLVQDGFLERDGFAQLSEYPMVSVIIPVRNRPGEIAACLASLDSVDYPPDKVEIIVVDDASTDHTKEVIREFPVRLIEMENNMQAPFCRNLAAEQAIGDILAFIDSDCLATADWLSELVPAFQDSAVAAVGGQVDGFLKESALDRYEMDFSALNVSNRLKRTRPNDRFFYVPSCNLLVRSDLFNRLDGFNDRLTVGEDVDLCWRIQDMGLDLMYLPAGAVCHKHRNRLIPFSRRRFDYGTSEPILQKQHRNRSKRFRFPPGATAFGLFAGLGIGLKLLPFLIICCLIPVIDAAIRKDSLRRKCVPIGHIRLLSSVLREYLFFYYNLCSFFSRYYLLFIVILWSVSPPVSIILLGMHLVVGIVKYLVKRPYLTLPKFLFFFTLEQLSYQSGVWWGCMKLRYFRSLLPRITWR